MAVTVVFVSEVVATVVVAAVVDVVVVAMVISGAVSLFVMLAPSIRFPPCHCRVTPIPPGHCFPRFRVVSSHRSSSWFHTSCPSASGASSSSSWSHVFCSSSSGASPPPAGPSFAVLTFASMSPTLYGWNSQAQVSAACAWEGCWLGCDVLLLGSCQEWGVVVCTIRVVDRELVGDLSSLAFALLSSPGFVSLLSLAFSLMLRLQVVRSS